MPVGEIRGIAPLQRVISTGYPLKVKVSESLLGRILNGIGKPMDGKPLPGSYVEYPVIGDSPHPLRRRPITEPLPTGVKAIDGVLTIGKGQRIGIFSGSGVGKTTLLGMIARGTSADVVVLGLIGERGREVRDFIEKNLSKVLHKSVVVVATSDTPPVVRLRAAFVATAIAEFFRDRGADVLLLIDSITRFAWAQRELGLALGEPPSTKGYTPSVFALLPQLMERAGCSDKGTITAIYTVLMEADDITDPLVDHCRSILDGHIVLSRDLAARGHFPAIDVLNSVSRLAPEIVSEKHRKAANLLREVVATYSEAEDLINIGAYSKGSNPSIDFALSKINEVNAFLRQDLNELYSWGEILGLLVSIFKDRL